MPTYNYQCQDCGRRFRTFLTYAEYDKGDVSCPQCQGRKVKRLIGRIRFIRSEDSRLESLESMADPASLSGLEDDPQSMGRMMRQMSQEMGEDLGEEFDEVVGRLEKGESPDEIEAAMPDLGDGIGADLPDVD